MLVLGTESGPLHGKPVLSAFQAPQRKAFVAIVFVSETGFLLGALAVLELPL